MLEMSKSAVPKTSVSTACVLKQICSVNVKYDDVNDNDVLMMTMLMKMMMLMKKEQEGKDDTDDADDTDNADDTVDAENTSEASHHASLGRFS